MRLKNDTKLDFNSISSLDSTDMMKRVVEHMNLFIEDVSQVLNNINVQNLSSGEIKNFTLNSGQESILAPTGYNALILESSNNINSFTLSQKTSGLTLNVTTLNGGSTSVKILLLKL